MKKLTERIKRGRNKILNSEEARKERVQKEQQSVIATEGREKDIGKRVCLRAYTDTDARHTQRDREIDKVSERV